MKTGWDISSNQSVRRNYNASREFECRAATAFKAELHFVPSLCPLTSPFERPAAGHTRFSGEVRLFHQVGHQGDLSSNRHHRLSNPSLPASSFRRDDAARLRFAGSLCGPCGAGSAKIPSRAVVLDAGIDRHAVQALCALGTGQQFNYVPGNQALSCGGLRRKPAKLRRQVCPLNWAELVKSFIYKWRGLAPVKAHCGNYLIGLVYDTKLSRRSRGRKW